MKKNKIIILGLFLLSLIIVIAMISRGNRIKPLEEIAITNASEKILNYMEIIEESKSDNLDKYIIFAIVYNYYENNKSSISVDEVVSFINDTFNIKINEEKIIKLGITPDMVDKNILFNSSSREFKVVDIDKNNLDIANIKIVKYIKEDIEKKNNKYVVKYSKYIINDPYKIQDYYEHKKNNEVLSDIKGYLSGTKNISYIKKHINEKNISEFGKKEKDVVITYITLEHKILIDSIE